MTHTCQLKYIIITFNKLRKRRKRGKKEGGGRRKKKEGRREREEEEKKEGSFLGSTRPLKLLPHYCVFRKTS